MTDDIKLPPLSRLRVPLIEADVDLLDIKVLAQWCERIATDYARAAVLADRASRDERLREEIDQLRDDAARYRWLRQRWGRVVGTYDGDSGRVVEISAEPEGDGWDVEPETLDAAIDNAMSTEGWGNDR